MYCMYVCISFFLPIENVVHERLGEFAKSCD